MLTGPAGGAAAAAATAAMFAEAAAAAGSAGLKSGELSDGEVSEFGFMMWNCEPVEPAELWCWWEMLVEERLLSIEEKG